MQKCYVKATRIACTGKNAASRDDVATATCTLTNGDKSVTVDSKTAFQTTFDLVDALTLVGVGADSAATGGRFGATALNVKCASRANRAFAESAAQFDVPSADCTLNTSVNSSALNVTDAQTPALELYRALEAAGVKATTATGRTTFGAKTLRCKSSHSTVATCTF